MYKYQYAHPHAVKVLRETGQRDTSRTDLQLCERGGERIPAAAALCQLYHLLWAEQLFLRFVKYNFNVASSLLEYFHLVTSTSALVTLPTLKH